MKIYHDTQRVERRLCLSVNEICSKTLDIKLFHSFLHVSLSRTECKSELFKQILAIVSAFVYLRINLLTSVYTIIIALPFYFDPQHLCYLRLILALRYVP